MAWMSVVEFLISKGTFNLVLNMVFWILKTFDSNHFHKTFGANLIQNKLCSIINYK